MGLFTRESSAPSTQPYSAYRALTGAAARVNVRDKTQVEQITRRRSQSVWQDDAWEYYDLIGEVKYAFRLFANVLSRIRLYAAYVADEDSPPSPIKNADVEDAVKEAATKAMKRVFSVTGQPDILRKSTINLLVAGECYLVQFPPKWGVRDREQWKILSTNELVMKNGRTYYREGKTQQQAEWEELPESTFVGRIWNEHARYASEADSSMRALVDTCDDLFLYTRAARASARSRLNAGAFFVPDTMSVTTDVVTDDPEDLVLDPEMVPEATEAEDDQFEQEMLDHFSTPISDETSAAAVVPFLIRGPREDGAALKHIKFDRPFDPQLAQRAERALERILQGIDLPKDIVTGLANIKYSNAVQIEESMYKSHVEPLVLLLCDAFRLVYLQPALEAAGVDPETMDKIVVWYDPSAIMTAPDKSNAANVGFDKFVLSADAWRRANGFGDDDAPTGEEVAKRMAITRGQLNDAITEALLRTIMPEVLDAARAQSIADSPSPLPPGVQEALGGQPGTPADPNATPPPANPDLPPIVDNTQPPPQ